MKLFAAGNKPGSSQIVGGRIQREKISEIQKMARAVPQVTCLATGTDSMTLFEEAAFAGPVPSVSRRLVPTRYRQVRKSCGCYHTPGWRQVDQWTHDTKQIVRSLQPCSRSYSTTMHWLTCSCSWNKHQNSKDPRRKTVSLRQLTCSHLFRSRSKWSTAPKSSFPPRHTPAMSWALSSLCLIDEERRRNSALSRRCTSRNPCKSTR